MFEVTRLPVEAFDRIWTINALSGGLLRSLPGPYGVNGPTKIPAKVLEALQFCDNPFLLSPPRLETRNCQRPRTLASLRRMHARLIWLGNQRFFFSLLYAGLYKQCFENSERAMAEIASLPEQRSEDHCLQRTLLTAKTSATFQRHGVIFVGALLPTALMHSWIIENGTQPDLTDRAWVNYRPLLAISRKAA